MSEPTQKEASKGTVLVTGANGYIAGHIILTLLQSGYTVRGTVRSLARTREPLLGPSSPFHPYASSGLFSLVEVPDITAPGAFDAAFHAGAPLTAIVHGAQPVTFDNPDARAMLEVPIQGTLNIASAAAAQLPALQSFVLMSSVAAVGVPGLGAGGSGGATIKADQWSDLDVMAEALRARGQAVPGPLAYAAGKTAAERALWKLAPRKFALACVNPVFVAGPAAVAPADAREAARGSGGFVCDILAGRELPPAEGLLGHGAHVDVRDVARLTAFLVEHPRETDGKRFLAASAWVSPRGVAKVLREAYPERKGVIQGAEGEEEVGDDFAFPEEGPRYDTQTVVELTGQDWIPFKKTILDAAKACEGLL
ncbi:NAD dependent epimerase/dehydratase [Camillea tinctor]|nr:NAD dependent epimerase/dehydratase [Camillea tinctor]